MIGNIRTSTAGRSEKSGPTPSPALDSQPRVDTRRSLTRKTGARRNVCQRDSRSPGCDSRRVLPETVVNSYPTISNEPRQFAIDESGAWSHRNS